MIIIATVGISALTFLSGFGLGTLLLPVFILFFPVDVAIAATAIVHLANNLFKAILVGRHANFSLLWKFAAPAAVCALLGAALLVKMAGKQSIASYTLMGHYFTMTPVKLLVAGLMLLFSLLELLPQAKALTFSPRYIPVGGAISGFFGGLTGHQGALRSAFLIRLGLDKETFVSTGVLSAIVIDLARLLVYGATFLTGNIHQLAAGGEVRLLVAGILSAFLGAVLGYFFFKKVNLAFIHKTIGALLIIYATLLGAGMI